MAEAVYLAVALIGFLHGLEPGHGWPIAMVYAAGRPDPVRWAFISGWVISMAHLVSSIAVVAVYVILSTVFLFSIPYVNVLAGVGLAILGLKFFFEKPKGTLEENHGPVHDFKIRGRTYTCTNILTLQCPYPRAFRDTPLPDGHCKFCACLGVCP